MNFALLFHFNIWFGWLLLQYVKSYFIFLSFGALRFLSINDPSKKQQLNKGFSFHFSVLKRVKSTSSLSCRKKNPDEKLSKVNFAEKVKVQRKKRRFFCVVVAKSKFDASKYSQGRTKRVKRRQLNQSWSQCISEVFFGVDSDACFMCERAKKKYINL